MIDVAVARAYSKNKRVGKRPSDSFFFPRRSKSKVRSAMKEHFIDKVKAIVPWEVTVVHNMQKTMLLILPGVLVEIVPGAVYGSNYLVKFGEHDACRYSTKSEGHVLGTIGSIVKGELDRIGRTHVPYRALATMVESLEGQLKGLKMENDALREELADHRRHMDERLDEVLGALTLHPAGAEARVLKKDFFSHALDQRDEVPATQTKHDTPH